MNGAAHRDVGRQAGVALSAIMARKQAPVHAAIEIVAGYLGGEVGGQLPNTLEPSTWGPRHRGIAHSWAAMGGQGLFIFNLLPRAQESLRAEADRHETLAAQTNGLAWLFHELFALACRFAAGAAAGVVGGYASHLVLDAQTPMGLPLAWS